METGIQNRKKSTAGIIVYLLLSFLLGLIYFILTVVGLSVGLGTAIIWVGVLLLVGTFGMIRGIGAIERSLAREMLGVAIAEPRPRRNERGLWRQAVENMRDPLTWKTLLYVFLKFPMGIISFCITITLLSLALGLVLAPLGYWIATFVLQINGIHVHSDGPAWVALFDLNITGTFDSLMLAKAFVYTLVGIAFWFLARPVLRALGQVSGELARALLSPIEQEADMQNPPFSQANPNRGTSYAYDRRPDYERGYAAEYRPAPTRDDTQPRAIYQEQPEMPPQEMPFQYQG
jgi:hypothetical protein